METGEKTEKLRRIRDEVVNLTSSPLYQYRTENNYHAVLGEGNHDAELMFIGEAPGKNEALQGRPFCGAAGKILDELLAAIGLDRTKVYITNVVKDRPPENRDPTPEEIELYSPFLERQINIIQPKVVVALGRYAMNYLMELFDIWEEIQPISKIHGEVFDAEAEYGKIKVVPLYHPAAAIYNRTTREALERDFEKLQYIIP